MSSWKKRNRYRKKRSSTAVGIVWILDCWFRFNSLQPPQRYSGIADGKTDCSDILQWAINTAETSSIGSFISIN